MDDQHTQYAQFRTILGLSITSAARRAGLSVDEAKKFETSEDWEQAKESAKNIEGLRLAGRKAVFEAVAGENEDLPEHTRLQIAKWALGRIDDEFMSPEFRKDRQRSSENPLEDISDEKLRELRDEFDESEEPDEVTLDVE